MSRTRPGRVRTKRTNRRPALLLSTVAPQDVNLREGEFRSIVCPDCQTWRRLMGETTLKIREHCDDERCDDEQSAGHDRCPGSNQLVVADITNEQWDEDLLAVDTTVMHRRPTTVRRKPKRPAAPAVTRMLPVARSAAAAREAMDTHRAQCAACRGKTVDGKSLRLACADLPHLVAAYVQLMRTEPQREEATRAAAARKRAFDRRYARQASRKNTANWAAQATTHRGQLTKRAGTTVEEQNNTCRTVPGAVSALHGPQVPTEPIHLNPLT